MRLEKTADCFNIEKGKLAKVQRKKKRGVKGTYKWKG